MHDPIITGQCRPFSWTPLLCNSDLPVQFCKLNHLPERDERNIGDFCVANLLLWHGSTVVAKNWCWREAKAFSRGICPVSVMIFLINSVVVTHSPSTSFYSKLIIPVSFCQSDSLVLNKNASFFFLIFRLPAFFTTAPDRHSKIICEGEDDILALNTSFGCHHRCKKSSDGVR